MKYFSYLILVPSAIISLIIICYTPGPKDFSRSLASVTVDDSCLKIAKNFLKLPHNGYKNAIDGTITKSVVHLSGESGYFKKIEMIDNAKPKSTIRLAYFIFEDDYSSSFLAQKLIQAVKRDVRVEIVMDYMMTEKYVDWIKFLVHNGINIKRFRPPTKDFVAYLKTNLKMSDADSFLKGLSLQNPELIMKGMMSSEQLRPIIEENMGKIVQFKAMQSSGKLSAEQVGALQSTMLLQLITSEKNIAIIPKLAKMRKLTKTYLKRMHHKILISETKHGKEFIVGGRNISDEYHISPSELDSPNNLLKGRSYPFIDSEISGVFNSATEESDLVDSFKMLWDSTLAESVNASLTETRRLDIEASMNEKAAHFNKNKSRLIKRKTSGSIDPSQFNHAQTGVKYVENGHLSNKSEKEIIKAWIDLIESSNEKIQIVSAYLYLYPELIEALTKASQKDVTIEIYTNSIQTTDLSIVNIGAYGQMKAWKEQIPGIKFFELALAPGKGSLHAKIINIDNQMVGIGSANTDPRTFLADTNNLMIMDYSKNPEMASQIFKYYIGNEKYPWHELTDERLEAILKHIENDEKSSAVRKAIKMKDTIEQL